MNYVECPHCHQKLSRKDTVGLTTFTCPHCGTKLRKYGLHPTLTFASIILFGILLGNLLTWMFPDSPFQHRFALICQTILFIADILVHVYCYPFKVKHNLAKTIIHDPQ